MRAQSLCKRLFVAGEHSQNVHIYPPLLQALPGRGVAGCGRECFRGYYVILSRILHLNFREFLF